MDSALNGNGKKNAEQIVASLVFVAARFSHLPGLRDLRDLFQERYKNGLKYYVNLVPPANIYSFNELVLLWEKKIDKTLEKIYLTEEQVLKNIEESPFPLNLIVALSHAIFVKGDQTNFEIEPSFGVEASELYPDVKYTTVDEYLSRFV
ncbi:hypothetical protein R6Q57_025740 [Mikania cordata]